MVYLIKATYLDGPQKGEHYILTKSGCVSDIEQTGIIPRDDCYKSLGGCTRACSAKQRENERCCAIEKQDREQRRTQGRPEPTYPLIHSLKSFEPYEVREPARCGPGNI